MPLEILERIENAYKEAFRSRDKLRTGALRLIKAQIKNKEVSVRPRELTEEHVIEALKSLAKQRRDSIEAYESAGEKARADAERAELDVIMSFLPEQLSAEEIERKVVEAIERLDLKSPGDLGKLMKEVMGGLKGRADGRLVNEIARKKLEELASQSV